MRILVVNDDGIKAEGIRRLAACAKKFGEVWVVAPARQCSAMSQRITVRENLEVRKADFPVMGVKAYSVDGTPADCVKVALNHLLPEKPDIVLQMEMDGERFIIRYGESRASLQELAVVDGSLMNPEKVGCMVGTMIGVYATGNGRDIENEAAFSWFEMKSED